MSNSLTCNQLPLQWPPAVSLNRIPENKSAGIALTVPVAGSGSLLPRPARDGQSIDESVQITLTYEKTQYSIVETIYYTPGVHRLPGEQKPVDAEVHVYFRPTRITPGQKLPSNGSHCIIIPIKINVNGRGRTYFEYLGRDAASRAQNMPSLGTLIEPNSPILLYKGKDMRLRTCVSPTQDRLCAADSPALIYMMLLRPTNMSAADHLRLRTATRPEPLCQPDPIEVLNEKLLRDFTSVYKTGIRINLPEKRKGRSRGSGGGKGVYETTAVKCEKINPDTDVKDGLVYVSKQSKSTLQNHLDAHNADALVPNSEDFLPGDFERFGAIGLGILFGVVAAYYLKKAAYNSLFH